MLVALCLGVGNIDQLKTTGYGLDIDKYVEQVFYLRRNLGVDVQFDSFRVSSRGYADFEMNHSQPIRRTINSFMTTANFYDHTSDLVKTEGPDHGQLSNLIGMYFRNPSDSQIRDRLRQEWTGCSYRQYARPVIPSEVVFGHFIVSEKLRPLHHLLQAKRTEFS